MKLTQKRLKELLHYEPSTGVFTWKVSPRRNVKAGDQAGYKHCNEYWQIKIERKRYLSHRLAWLYMTGHFPTSEIDHKNCNGFDNKWTNLREATHSQNCANSKTPKNNTSGIKGVSWHKRDKVWQANLSASGSALYLGSFDTKEQAASAYITAAEKYHGEFARVA